MKKLFLLLLITTSFSFPQNSAIIFTVDGLSIVNTIISENLQDDNNYLQTAINQMNFGNRDIEIVAFNWHRDAKKTDIVLKDLRKVMRQYYEKAQNENKKFIVISHSWGTFLTYMALSFESQVSDPIICDLFITLSSPMGTYYAAEMSGYSKKSDSEKIKTTDNKIIGLVNQWYYGLKYSECYNCYPRTKKWINVWAWGDLISGPLKELNSNAEDINVDEESMKSGTSKRNISTTIDWHAYTQLLPNGRNEILIERIKSEICSLIKCSSVEQGAVNIGFIIDSSGSMAQNDPYNTRISAMQAIIDQLSGNEKVFVVDFDSHALWVNDGNYYNFSKDLLKAQISQINSSGETNVGAGLEVMRRAIESSAISGKTGVILLTDGIGDYSGQSQWFTQNGIPIYTVSFVGEANSKLLEEIAFATQGKYFRANNANDIVALFNQFINTLSGNATLTVYEHNISQGERLFSSFVLDYSRYLFVTLIWRGSKIGLTLTSPDGTIYSYQNPPANWVEGKNYTTFKIENPIQGKWNTEFYGLDIPPGGEDFVFYANSNSKLKVDVDDRILPNGKMEFSIDVPSNISSNINAAIQVTTPLNRIEDISKNFLNGLLDYFPRDGQGNYNFEFDLRGIDFQRFITRTMLLGEDQLFKLLVTRVEGNYLIGNFGEDVGAFPGLKCSILSSVTNNKYASGYITFVSNNESTIEIQDYTSPNFSINDIVELDLIQWSRDFQTTSSQRIITTPVPKPNVVQPGQTNTVRIPNISLTNNNIGNVINIEGSTIIVRLDKHDQKLVGFTCTVYKEDYGKKRRIAKGVVNFVNGTNYTVDIQETYGDEQISINDIAEFTTR